MAESWKVSDDKLTYTFKLRKGQKWSNGEEVTAKDFYYGWKLAATRQIAADYSYFITDIIKGAAAYYEWSGPEATTDYDAKINANLTAKKDKFDGLKPEEKADYEKIQKEYKDKQPAELKKAEDALKEGVKVVDDYTLQVTLTTPVPYFLSQLAFMTFKPVNEKAYKSTGATEQDASKYALEADSYFSNGPYKLTKWAHKDHIMLEKNPGYWDAANVNVGKVKCLMIEDANSAVNAFKSGKLDMVGLNADFKAQMDAQGQPSTSYFDASTWYMQFNCAKAPFDNAKVRKAIGMAVDMDAYLKNVLKNGSVAATGLTPDGINGADGEYSKARGDIMADVHFDAAKAKQLLTEGLKEAKVDPSSFKFTYLTDNSTAAKKEATYYQEQWKKNLGVTVEIKSVPFKSRIAAMDSGDFEIVGAGWSPDYNDPMTYIDMFLTGGGNNQGKYSNTAFDKLVKDAKAESDFAKREEMLIKAEKLLVSEDAAIYPTYFRKATFTISKKLSGITRTAFQGANIPEFTDGAKING